MSLLTSPRQNKPPSPSPLMPPPPHITTFPCSFGEEPPEENRVHLGHAIMSSRDSTGFGALDEGLISS